MINKKIIMLSRSSLVQQNLRRLLTKSFGNSKDLGFASKDNQLYNRALSKINLNDFRPRWGESSNISPLAIFVGEVAIGDNTVIKNNTIIKGDLNSVCVDFDCLIYENCSLSTVSALDKTGQEARVFIARDCILLPGVNVVSSETDEGVIIGSNSTLCEGSRVGESSIIGPNSVVPPYRYIPGFQLWAGNPVVFVKDLTKKEINSLRYLRQYIFKHEKHIKKLFFSENTAYIQKEILDDLEDRMVAENTSKNELLEALRDIEELRCEGYFEVELIEAIRKKVE